MFGWQAMLILQIPFAILVPTQQMTNRHACGACLLNQRLVQRLDLKFAMPRHHDGKRTRGVNDLLDSAGRQHLTPGKPFVPKQSARDKSASGSDHLHAVCPMLRLEIGRQVHQHCTLRLRDGGRQRAK